MTHDVVRPKDFLGPHELLHRTLSFIVVSPKDFHGPDKMLAAYRTLSHIVVSPEDLFGPHKLLAIESDIFAHCCKPQRISLVPRSY